MTLLLLEPSVLVQSGIKARHTVSLGLSSEREHDYPTNCIGEYTGKLLQLECLQNGVSIS